MGMGVGQEQNVEAAKTTRQMLYWMAVCATVLGALYFLGLAGKLIVNGTVHALSSQSIEVAAAIVAIAWNVVLLVMFAALRREYSGGRPLFTELALIFMLLVCATSSVNWFVQLAVLPRLAVGDPSALAMLDSHNELSIPYAMEHLGWGLFYGLAALFAAAGISGGRLERRIRWLLAAGGMLSLLHFAGVIVASPLLGDLGYMAWGVLLPLSTALLAARYRKEI